MVSARVAYLVLLTLQIFSDPDYIYPDNFLNRWDVFYAAPLWWIFTIPVPDNACMWTKYQTSKLKSIA